MFQFEVEITKTEPAKRFYSIVLIVMPYFSFFLMQKYCCEAITWLRNGQEHHEDVDLGELLPNEDETFQKTILHVAPDEWKKNQHVPVVEHQENTIQKILTESESKIKSNESMLLIVQYRVKFFFYHTLQ